MTYLCEHQFAQLVACLDALFQNFSFFLPLLEPWKQSLQRNFVHLKSVYLKPLTEPSLREPANSLNKPVFFVYHNIGITDGSNLANVVTSGYGIEQSVNIVQENHGLHVKERLKTEK